MLQYILFFVMGGAIVYITQQAATFYIKTKGATDEIPSMKKLLEKIDRGLSALNEKLLS